MRCVAAFPRLNLSLVLHFLVIQRKIREEAVHQRRPHLGFPRVGLRRELKSARELLRTQRASVTEWWAKRVTGSRNRSGGFDSCYR